MKYLCVLLFLFKFYDSSGCCDYYAKGYDGNYENVPDPDCREGPEDIWHPCPLEDLVCIGDFLAMNSQCRPTSGSSTLNPIRIPIMKFYMPVSNMTVTNTDVRTRGFENAKIKEFYLSISTGNVVLAVEVQKLNKTTQKSFWSYQRPAKEPIVLADYKEFEEDYVLFTVVIPKVPLLQLKYADIYATNINNLLKHYIGPKIYTSNNPTVNAEFAAFRANILTAVKEANVYYSHIFMMIFIQRFCEYYAKGYDGIYESLIDADCQEGPGNIYRPCDLHDYSCIRDFLALNSQCRPTFGSTPNPILLPIMKFYIPVVNMTITHTDIRIRGFESAKIIEFYLSIPTGNVVMAVAVQKLKLTSEISYYSYQRPAKEHITLADYVTFELEYVIYTVVIPKVPMLRLEHAEIYSDHTNNIPKDYIGPKAYTSNDPAVNAEFAAFRANLFNIVKEVNIFYSYLLMTMFIQSELCDFGVDSNDYLGFVANRVPMGMPAFFPELRQRALQFEHSGPFQNTRF